MKNLNALMSVERRTNDVGTVVDDTHLDGMILCIGVDRVDHDIDRLELFMTMSVSGDDGRDVHRIWKRR